MNLMRVSAHNKINGSIFAIHSHVLLIGPLMKTSNIENNKKTSIAHLWDVFVQISEVNADKVRNH